MNYHLAILSKEWIELILDGSKTIESRFSKIRCAPFGKVHAGDIVYLKESGGLVKGMFKVAEVEVFENLSFREIRNIFKKYGEAIFVRLFPADMEASQTSLLPPDNWRTANYATLIHIASPVKFESPFQIVKRRGDAHAWKVLDHPLHLCVECEDWFLVEVIEGPDGEQLICSEYFCSPCYARACVSLDEELAMSEQDQEDDDWDDAYTEDVEDEIDRMAELMDMWRI